MSRAILTDSERERLPNETDDLPEQERQRVYEAVSRVRRRISNELADDVRLLSEHRPDLLEELREVVCGRDDSGRSEG